MKNKKKILKTILEISILILSAFGTFFLGYHYGTKTFGPIARYNYHLDNDGNIKSDNSFDLQRYTYKTSGLMISDNGFYVNNLNVNNMYILLYDANNSYYDTLYTSGSNYSQNYFILDGEDKYGYYLYFSFGVVGASNEYIFYKMNDIGNFYQYWHFTFDTYFSETISYMGNFSIVLNSDVINKPYSYEPFGTWYTPQTYAREQWDRNYSILKQSKFDIVGYKEDGNYTSKPYYDELNIYEPFKRENNNKYYVSLEKVGFEDWDNSKTYEITQSFNNYVPIISPGYYIINRTLVDNFKQIQFSVKTSLQHEKYTSFNIVFGSNRTDAYYDFNNSWIYYYIPNSVVNDIRQGNDYYYEVPQFIIDSLQSRQVWDIKYSSLPNNSTSNFEEIEFYFDTSIFGYEIIYDDAYNNGYDVGYNNGRNDALNIDWLKRAISTIDDILNIKLLGPLTLGNIVAIPLIIGIVSFVIGWFK